MCTRVAVFAQLSAGTNCGHGSATYLLLYSFDTLNKTTQNTYSQRLSPKEYVRGTIRLFKTLSTYNAFGQKTDQSGTALPTSVKSDQSR